MTQKEAREVKLSLESEKELVRRELLGRLRDLEALPEKLRRTEQQLKDAQQEADAHERRNMEHSSALSEVRHKVCMITYVIKKREISINKIKIQNGCMELVLNIFLCVGIFCHDLGKTVEIKNTCNNLVDLKW